MPLTPIPGFNTVSVNPLWGVSVSVEFHNRERLLGNNYMQITDGGNGNPEEIVSLDSIRLNSQIDSLISDLRAYQGSDAFNWRFYPGGNYKLYYCTGFSESQLGTYYKQFRAQFSRHPDPQYDPQPATVADGLPWGVLTQPYRWDSAIEWTTTPNIFQSSKGEVSQRKAMSLFTAQNSKAVRTVELPDLTEARMMAIDLFLRQRRGRIPFQFASSIASVPATLWICPQYTITLTSNRGVKYYSMSLNLRHVFRAASGAAIAITPSTSINPTSATVAEGFSTVFTVSLSSTSSLPVSVPFTMSGTAANGTDYIVTTSPVTISPGSTTATITVTASTDAATEANETAIITLGTPTNATLGSPITATATITNVAAGYDTDAQAFFTATGITDTTIRNAVNALVLSLKTNGTWTKYQAIYPFVGGTAASHSYNLKNPATFQITWNGTVTHNANGITGNGSNGWGNTGYIPSVDSVLGNNHISLYSRTNAANSSAVEIGANSTSAPNGEWGIALNNGNAAYFMLLGGNNSDYPPVAIPGSMANTLGWLLASRVSQSTIRGYRNGTQVLSGSQAQTALLNNLIIILGSNNNNNAGRFSTANIALASIGSNLTDFEATTDYNAIQTFQTSLGRQV